MDKGGGQQHTRAPAAVVDHVALSFSPFPPGPSHKNSKLSSAVALVRLFSSIKFREMSLPAAAATGTPDEAFRIEVERFEEVDENYVWTLSLKGFQKGQWIYIYRKGERSYLRGTSGHTITDPTARTQVRAKASSFVVSKREEYEFRYVCKRVPARLCSDFSRDVFAGCTCPTRGSRPRSREFIGLSSKYNSIWPLSLYSLSTLIIKTEESTSSNGS